METSETICALEKLARLAASISKNTHGRKTSHWEVMIASLIFTRLTLNAFSILRISPGSSFCPGLNGIQIWDLSSTSSLSRDLMEAYLTLRYMIEPMASPVESDLRRKIWKYHEASERYKMMKAALPHSVRLSELRIDKDKLCTLVRDDSFFQNLNEKFRRRVLNGERFRLRTAEQLCQIAGVGQGYYESMFKFGSNHTHSSPYSISLLNTNGPMTPEAQSLLRVTLQVSAGFMALAIRDFISIFPEQLKKVIAEEQELLRFWADIPKWEQ